MSSPVPVVVPWIYATALTHTGDECLPWPFSHNKQGYAGTVYLNGESWLAQRLVCTLAHGEPPTPDHEAAHSCGRGAEGCISPIHLSWKTRTENEADKQVHGTLVNGVKHPLHKLLPSDVISIRTSLAPQRSIAADFGVSQAVVCAIRARKMWRHIP